MLKICRDELDQVADARPRPTTRSRRAIGQLSGSTVLGLEDTGALMNRIGKSELCWGEQMSVDDMLARIAAVTPDDVRAVAREHPGTAPLAVGHRPAQGQAGGPPPRSGRLTRSAPAKESTMSKLRVAVLGAKGRIGSEAVRAVEAADDLELVAALGRGDKLETLAEAGAQVAVELTTPASVMGNLDFCVRHGIHAVVGTTGWTDERLAQLTAWLDELPGDRRAHRARTSPSAPS